MQNQGRFSLEAMLRNAFALNQAGRLDDAARAAKGILKLQPKEPNALYLLGIVAHQQDDRKAAAQWFEKCRKADKNNIGAISGLAIIRMDERRHAEALKLFQRVLEKMPDDPPTLNNIGLAKKHLGDLNGAISFFERSVAAAPNYATARLNLGKALSDIGKVPQARTHYEEGLRLAPNLPDLHGAYADMLRFLGEHDRALDAFQRALQLDPGNLDYMVNYAGTLLEFGDTAQATGLLEKAMAAYPDNPVPALDLAEIVEADRTAGKERAAALYQTAIDIVDKRRGGDEEQAQVIHRLGRAYDKIGRHEEAFRCWKTAHDRWKQELASAGIGYRPSDHDANIDRIIDFFEANPRPVDHAFVSERAPIFVVGMMRSGTSLMEQILSSHSGIAGAGELMTLPDIVAMMESGRGHWTEALAGADAGRLEQYARRYLDAIRDLFPESPHIVDKLPANFLNVGLVRHLFPSATIIHTRRNAIDTALSIFMQKFSTNIVFCHDMQEIAHYYRGYRRIMEFWHALGSGAAGGRLRGHGRRPAGHHHAGDAGDRPGLGGQPGPVLRNRPRGQDSQPPAGPPAGLQILRGTLAAVRKPAPSPCRGPGRDATAPWPDQTGNGVEA